MTRRTGYKIWTLDSIERLNEVQTQTGSGQHRGRKAKALRLADLAREEADDA